MIRNIFHIIFSPSFYMFCDFRFEKIQFDFLFQKFGCDIKNNGDGQTYIFQNTTCTV